MGEYKESTDNPLHRRFGTWKNTVYIVKKMKQYCPAVIPIALMGIVCGSVLSYYWGFIGKYVIDLVQVQAPMAEKTERLLWLLVIVGGAAAALTFGNVFSNNRTWYRFIYVRMQMILERVDKALGLNYQMLESPEVLDVHERATQATGGNMNGVEGMMNLMVTLGGQLFTVVVTFGSVLVLSPWLVAALTGLCILQFFYYRKIIRTDKKEVWDKLAPVWRQVHYMTRITQDFDFAKDIRLFDLSGFLLKKQREIYDRREERIDYSKELWFRHSLVVGLLFLVGKGLIYGALFYAVLKKGLSIGSFTLYLALATAFSQSLLQFLHRYGDYERASLEVDDFRTFMELDCREKEDTIPIPASREWTIEFHDVSYRYHKQEKNALDHLNLTLHPGEKLAVVGLNGAGKTTMIKLLLRLYDPTEGYITLNGVDIRRFSREEYYRLFSPVFQNVEVLAFPIAENISMKTTQETDADRAEKAAEQAGLGDKISSLSKGIWTELLKIIAEDGVDLSGGEKQKLALARALYKAAPVVVLDEPTAALDALAEQQLYERFDQMIGEKSAVYISHRLASTRFCDKVAMFMDGRMIEYGTHDRLMEQGGEYAGMFEMQAQYYQEERKEAQA